MNDDPALDEVQRACSHFAHAARHELLTPLSGLSMLVSLLPREVREVDELAGRAEAATKRMTGLLRAIVDYVDAGLPIAQLGTVDLAVVVDEAVRSLRQADRRVQEAELHVGTLPTVRGHAGWLRRVVAALLDNAVRYAGEARPHIEVRAAREVACWRVEVADRGIGLTEAQCEQVLRPFSRLHSWDELPGFGLGLATARRTVRVQGGDLGLQPRDGGGLVAWLRLSGSEEELRPSP